MKARARNALTTLLLLALAAAAISVARFGVFLRGEEERAEETRSRKVLALDPARAREVRLLGAGGEIRLAKEGETWRLVAPVRADADAGAVGRLLDRLASLERRATSAKAGAPPESLRPYGLEAPRTRLEVVLDDGRTERLALGDDSGFDGAMFVQPTSGEVAVVASSARADLEPGLDALRDRRILRFDRDRVHGLRIEAGRARVEVRRDPAQAPGAPAAWRLVAPREGPADSWKVTNGLYTLSTLEAEGEGAPAAGGLATPERTWVLLGEDGKEIARLVAGRERDGRVPVRSGASGPVQTVEAYRVKGLPSGEKDLEAPPPAPAAPAAPAQGAPAPEAPRGG
ncbi:MAG TPA: DUF4340 domain-containing protein [Anaeromyxobacteraceae bacterium]|nr:DUF4340 domain-containing protein [Anaeromyxobacteraceae bacterium]